MRPRDGDNPGPTNGLAPERRDNFLGHEIALSNGMLIAGLLQGVNIDQLAHCQLQGHWRNDADLANGPTPARLGAQAGINPTPLLSAARLGAFQAVYEQNTEEAVQPLYSACPLILSMVICFTGRATWKWRNGPWRGCSPGFGRPAKNSNLNGGNKNGFDYN